MGRILLLVVLVALLPSLVSAWGRDGHQMIGAMAESRLTPETLAQVRQLLGPGETVSSVSTWADVVRPDRPATFPWHYVDFPISEDKYEPRRCVNGDCVNEIIQRQVWLLSDQNTTETLTRSESLKFLIHFIQDQSQPLHNANEGDEGGNRKKVVFYGRDTNLHSVWDTRMIEQELELKRMSPQVLAEELNAEIRPEQVRIWTRGGPDDWTEDSHRVAIEFVYPGWSEVMGDDYYFKNFGTVRVQLQKGAVRLAHVLNQIFDKNYDGVPVIRRAVEVSGDAPFAESGAFQQLRK